RIYTPETHTHTQTHTPVHHTTTSQPHRPLKTALSFIQRQRMNTLPPLSGSLNIQTIPYLNTTARHPEQVLRTMKQCREKLKKLKSDYRSMKDHNGRSGSNWRCWKWFSQMDAIYRPASNRRESGLDSITAGLLETMLEDGENLKSFLDHDKLF
uniref:Myb/SANT-like DNA-binding domain-containing protein n=1 Tax=Amphiprion percula TaxID=161767 RepID=A0A3P8RN94_AMPPE